MYEQSPCIKSYRIVVENRVTNNILNKFTGGAARKTKSIQRKIMKGAKKGKVFFSAAFVTLKQQRLAPFDGKEYPACTCPGGRRFAEANRSLTRHKT